MLSVSDHEVFGFIARDDKNPDLFFHFRALAGVTVKEGDRVSFEIGTDREGRPRAEKTSGPMPR